MFFLLYFISPQFWLVPLLKQLTFTTKWRWSLQNFSTIKLIFILVTMKCFVSWHSETVLLSHSTSNFQFIHLFNCIWIDSWLPILFNWLCQSLPSLFILISVLILIGSFRDNHSCGPLLTSLGILDPHLAALFHRCPSDRPGLSHPDQDRFNFPRLVQTPTLLCFTQWL